MNIKEANKFINEFNEKCATDEDFEIDGLNYSDFYEFICDTNDEAEVLGKKIKKVDEYRSKGSGDYDGYDIVFSIDDEFFMMKGYYSSHCGVDMGDATLTKVEKATKTVEYWKKI